MSRKLRIHMLGGLMLEYEGKVLPPIATRIGRSLFAYLVDRRDTQPTRDLVAGTFWPEMTETQARRRLSQTLWQIQNSLAENTGGETYLISDANTVYFNANAPYWLDVAEFERGLRNIKSVGREPVPDEDFAEVAAAVELYRGDFLAGFYDDWIDIEQERLREQLYAGLRYLVRMSKARGDFEGALVHARRLALHDPLNEGSHQEVMRLLLLLGRANEALRQYEHARSVIADELGTLPSPATDELRDHIAEQRRLVRRPFSLDAQSRLFGSQDLPLVGRDRERGRLVAAMEGVLAGRGAIGLLEGSPGAGKTRLAHALAEDAQWRGLSVLWGAATEGQPVRNYEPFIQLLDDGLTPLRVERLSDQLPPWTRGALARLLPRLDQWAEESRQPVVDAAAMREAMFEAIAAMCEMNPTLLVVDDVQWADPDSLEMISLLADRTADRSLMICLCYRADEARERSGVWRLLERLDRAAADRIAVKPLTEADTRQLLLRIAPGAITGDLVEKLHSDTAGNPLFILETLRALHELDRTAALDETSLNFVSLELPVSNTVADLVASRIARLPERERTILQVLAVHGSPSEPDLLQVAAGIGRTDLLEGLEALGRRGFTEVAGSRYTAGHDIQRRAAYRAIDPAHRSKLHDAVARALEEFGSKDAAALAFHHHQAGNDRVATGFYLSAGRDAQRVLALHTAAEHFRAAAQLLDADEERLGLALRELEMVLDLLGHRDEQLAVLDRLGSMVSTDPDSAYIMRRRARFLANTDRLEEAADLALRAYDLETASGSVEGQHDAITIVAWSKIWSGHPRQAIPLLDRLEHASPGSAAAEARVRISLGSALSQAGDYEAARAQIQRAVGLAGRASDPLLEAEAAGALAVVHAAEGRLDEAVALQRHVIEECQAAGYRYLTAVHKGNLASTLFYQGEIGESLTHSREALAHCRFLGNQRVGALIKGNLAATLTRFVGDFEAAEELASSAYEYLAGTGHTEAAAQALGVLASIRTAAGAHSEAYDLLERAIGDLELPRDWRRASLLGHLGHLHLSAGSPEEALLAVGEGRRICRQLGLDRLDLDLAATGAEAHLALDSPETAVEIIAGARRRYGDSPSSYLAPFVHGRALEVQGSTAEAAELFRTARALASAIVESLDAADRRHTDNIESYALVEDAFVGTHGSTVQVRLPAVGVPSGRPLTHTDYVDVTWTIDTPDDGREGPAKAIRHRRLERLLREADQQGARPTLSDLADALSVSVTTIRRDLAEMREQGLPVHTRGSRS